MMGNIMAEPGRKLYAPLPIAPMRIFISPTERLGKCRVHSYNRTRFKTVIFS